MNAAASSVDGAGGVVVPGATSVVGAAVVPSGTTAVASAGTVGNESGANVVVVGKMVVVGVNVPDDVDVSVEHDDVITTAPARMTASRRIPPA
jgi:hypothetical protein